MTESDIEKVLNTTLVTCASAGANPVGANNISWANVEYDPVIGTTYLKADFIPATSASVGIGVDTPNRITGFFQVSIVTTANEGKARANEIAAQLKTYFKRGITLSHNGVDVRCTRFRLPGYAEEEAWFTQIVQIDWRADIAN
jgi:hypothetical protein